MYFPVKSLFLVLYFFSISHMVNAEDVFVSVQPASRQVKITGFSRARSSMVLSSEVAGKIKQVNADIGDKIPAQGDFACLDDTFVIIDIKSAENDIAQHNVDINYFNKQVSRYKKLVEKNSASISLLDDFERQLGNSRRLKQRAGLRKQRLQESKRRHCISAPAGWSVVERYVEPGQWIGSGDQVAKISDYSQLLVPLALSVQELKQLQKKTENLKVYLANYDITVPASVERISPAFDEQSHKIRVDLLIQEQVPDFRGGVRAELLLDMPDEFGAWTIPRSALDERFEETWVERKDGERISVSLLGYVDKKYARITSTEIKANDLFKVLH